MSINDVMIKAMEIQEAMKQSKEYQEVKNAETQMMQEEEVLRRVGFFRNVQEEYNECIRLSLSLKEVERRLYETQVHLFSHPLVAAYQTAFQSYNQQVQQLTKIIFEGVINEKDFQQLLNPLRRL